MGAQRLGTAAVSLLLVVLVAAVFGRALSHDFVNYDDPEYVYKNPRITSGLSVEGVKWAFTSIHANNWHPLTTLTHMLDVQLFGLNPAGHHFTNLLLHGATAVALFLVLQAMTGAFWRSAFVAAVFAVHPLRVESVAWIAERKDVLSGLFFMLTLAAYLSYSRRRSIGRYLLVAGCLAAGLMAKPMLVTVPFLLLLLDFWPLRRLTWSAVLEKLPLVVLAAAAAVITLVVQTVHETAREPMPLLWRLANAAISYLGYIGDGLWPVKLAPLYPHPEYDLSFFAAGLAAVVLLAITAAVLLWARRVPYLLTGWFWYAGMLVPVIGIVEVGAHARADRYTYLPQIGLLIVITWGISELAGRWRHRESILATTGGAAVLLLAVLAWWQTGHWRNSETLWRHTLKVTEANHVAHNNLGELAYEQGRFAEALARYDEALAIRSRGRVTRYDVLRGLYHNNRGSALQQLGRLEEALSEFRKAMEWQPDYYQAHLNYGGALSAGGQIEEAVAVFRRVTEEAPEMAQAHSSLGTALLQSGREREAVEHYERALELERLSFAAMHNLLWLRATSSDPAVRDGKRAVELAAAALKGPGADDPFLLHKVAAAHAANGDFGEAVRVAERALRLAEGKPQLAEELRRNLARYRSGLPAR